MQRIEKSEGKSSTISKLINMKNGMVPVLQSSLLQKKFTSSLKAKVSQQRQATPKGSNAPTIIKPSASINANHENDES